MKHSPNKISATQLKQPDLEITFGDFDWNASVFKELHSFFRTTADIVQFSEFVQAILGEDRLLAEIVQHRSMREGILRYHFEQIGFVGASVDSPNNRVVLLRIEGELFAARLTAKNASKTNVHVVEISGFADNTVLQVLDCAAFLDLWSKTTGNAPEDYDTNSSIQPYLHSLIKGEPLQMHGRNLQVESILGQGLEGTVFRVRDIQTQKPFALKVTYKDLRNLFNYWSAGMQQIGSQWPEMFSYLCEFLSCEPAANKGSTLLMQYVSVIPLQSLNSEDRLAKGLRILADVIHCITTLHRVGICHGDLGVSNVFIQQQADGCEQAMLIDPYPDACDDFDAYQRKDLFGVAHILYWIVTGSQWPEGTYPYLLKVMANDHDPNEGAKIFSASPLKKPNKEYASLHAAAVRCLCDLNSYETMTEQIAMICQQLNESPVVTIGHTKHATTITSTDVQRRIANALKPIGSGVFMPLFSLPSYFGNKNPKQREYGMGDCGPAAREFAKLLQSMGQKFWLLLPVSPTDQGNCPYRTDSSFALHLNIISPEDLLADGWITQKELDSVLPVVEDTSRVPLENESVFTYKRQLLAFAFKRRRHKNKASWQQHYKLFVQQEADWLEQYAVYKTIEAHYPARWTQWPEPLRDAEPSALEQFAKRHAEALERENFYQFLAQHYFLQLRCFAEKQGVSLIGDMPAYSMHGSADVWAYRNAFELTENGERTLVAGAPPDVFDAQGQGWNHPMYRWDTAATLQFLKKKYVRMKQLFASGFVRDDHIIGKVTPWGYTFGQPPAQGHRVTGSCLGNSLFDTILETIPDLRTFLIGEDLGILTTETRRVMQHYGFMGMKVLQFIPFNQGPAAVADNLYTPGNYSETNAVLLGTHDAPVIRQWWREELNDAGREHFVEYLQKHLEIEDSVTEDNVAAQFTELAMQQGGQLVIHQVPDLIFNRDKSVGLADARMNDPSSRHGPDKNWSWRLQPDAFGKRTIENLRRLTLLTNRTPEQSILRLKACWPGDEVVSLSLNILRNNGVRSKALADQLESIVSRGLVRKVPLGKDCSSAVYSHLNGQRYLLLSLDCAAPLEQKAYSLICGLETYMQQDDPNWKTPLKQFKEDAPVEAAHTMIERIDRSLRDFVILSSDNLREEMIIFIGNLLDSEEPLDKSTRKQLRSIGISADERSELVKKFQQIWTDLWVTYEQRGVSRKNIVEGILTGELRGARVSLRGLRWRMANAYREELSAKAERLKKWTQIIDSWTKLLGLKSVKKCLFGTPDLLFAHDLDGYGQAQGLSGLLGLIRKAHRKEQPLEDALEQFRDYAISIVRSASEQVTENINVAALWVDARDEGSLQLLLEITESSLLRRLAELNPSVDSALPEFPARIDLQVHSYHSDCGGQSIAQIVYQAYRRGLKTLAITDHQCFDGIEQALKIGDLLGIQVIPAVELYTGIKRENHVDQRRDVLVYFPDVPRFLSWWKQGLDPETWQLFDDGWNRKLNGHEWGNVPIRRVTDWARARRGVPVLAHPGLWSAEKFHEDGWSYESFERLFLETGLAGIEISHSRLPFEENTKRFVALVQEFNRQHAENPIVFTMGTDSHISETIGRANLTDEAITFIAEAFAPEKPSANLLHELTLNQLQDAAKRITDKLPLYQLRKEVLDEAYPGLTAYDRPLDVRRTDTHTLSETIVAGIKQYKNQSILVIVNRDRREQFEGKDWGSINVTSLWTIDATQSAPYQFRNLISGESYVRAGAELVNEGLHVGLMPNETLFLELTEANRLG